MKGSGPARGALSPQGLHAQVLRVLTGGPARCGSHKLTSFQ